MLSLLRRGGVVQMVMAAVVLAIIIVFIVQFRAGAGSQTASLSEQCTARVYGYCISPKEYGSALGLVVPRGADTKLIKALGLPRHLIDGLIERELLVKEAERLGIDVSEEEVNDDLVLGHAHVSLPAAEAARLGYTLQLTEGDGDGLARELVRQLPVLNPKTEVFDQDIYERTVRAIARRSPREFKAMQTREIIAARVRDLVRSRVRVSVQEAFRLFERERSKATVRFVRLERDWFARYAADVSDATVDAWALQHAAEVDPLWKAELAEWKAGCVLASEIFMAVDPALGDDAKVLARSKIDEAKKLLDAKMPFELVAKELGEGPAAVVGGERGCISAKRYGEGSDALLASLGTLHPQQVSDVIESKRGFHILRHDGLLTSEDAERVGRRVLARPLLAAEAGTRLGREAAEALIVAVKGGQMLETATADLARRYVRGLDAWEERRAAPGKVKDKKPQKKPEGASDTADGPEPHPALEALERPRVQISGSFTLGGNPISGSFGSSPARLAFALGVDAVHPEPIATATGSAVMQLKEKSAATRAEFDKEKESLLRQVQLAKANEALAAYVARLRTQAGDKVRIDEALLADSAQGRERPE